jgi:hypothetical protein
MYAADSVAVGPHLYSMCRIGVQYCQGTPVRLGTEVFEIRFAFLFLFFFRFLSLTPSPLRIGESHAMNLHLRTSALCVLVCLSFLEFLTSPGLNGSGYVQGRIEDNNGLIAVGTPLHSTGPPPQIMQGHPFDSGMQST